MSQAEFDKAAKEVKALNKTPSDDELLKLYGLYKQATMGDNKTSKPGMTDFKGKAKWEAWDKNKGMTQEAARQEYITFLRQLQAKQ